MNSAGEGTRAGPEGVLCPLVGPLPEGGEASGSRYWLTLGPVHVKQKAVITCRLFISCLLRKQTCFSSSCHNFLNVLRRSENSSSCTGSTEKGPSDKPNQELELQSYLQDLD